ncbi:MAG: class I SAM-dependent methyltransferase [Candidatus Uhrbacteria bacterium]
MPLQESPWDKFAKEDPMFYITTRSKERWREEDAFWKSGERTTDFIWQHLAPHIRTHRVAVEIGCGIGRLAVPMARRFVNLKVVDASPFMLSKLQQRCGQYGVGNISCYLPAQDWWSEPVDCVYSALTFQHLESFAEIENYVAKISRCLRGAAFLQFDARPLGTLSAMKRYLPDDLLPRMHRRGIRRIRRHPRELRALFRAYGLRTVQELDERSALHAFILTK